MLGESYDVEIVTKYDDNGENPREVIMLNFAGRAMDCLDVEYVDKFGIEFELDRILPALWYINQQAASALNAYNKYKES